MNVAQIKDEIWKLDRIDRLAICRWLDEEAVDDLIVRIGTDRARQIRQKFERRFNVTSPERQQHGKGAKTLEVHTKVPATTRVRTSPEHPVRQAPTNEFCYRNVGGKKVVMLDTLSVMKNQRDRRRARYSLAKWQQRNLGRRGHSAIGVDVEIWRFLRHRATGYTIGPAEARFFAVLQVVSGAIVLRSNRTNRALLRRSKYSQFSWSSYFSSALASVFFEAASCALAC